MIVSLELRLAGAVAALAALAMPSAAAALPTVSRTASLPAQLRLDLTAEPGQTRFLFVRQEADGVRFVPETEPEPGVPWTVTAPDCAVVTGTDEVFCSGPFTSLAVIGGDGNEGFETRRFDHPVLTDMAGGDDSVTGGRKDDSIGLGTGDDFAKGGPGLDRIYGWIGDDGLFGGAGQDHLIPGPGADRAFGEAGIDSIAARDGDRERRVDCGKGDDREERARVDRFDPRPRSG